MWGMRCFLLIIAVVMGQSVLAADKKPLIADPIVEKAIRNHFSVKKPTGELTKADLAKVTRLELDATQISDAGLKDVAKLQKLTGLYLDATQITDEGLKEVAKLKQLSKLHMRGTQVTDAGGSFKVLMISLLSSESFLYRTMPSNGDSS